MILWLHPFSGLSGDMLLGALVDLGAPVEGIRQAIASTGISGWDLEFDRRDAGGLMATRVDVRVDDAVPERLASELLKMVQRAEPEPVAAIAVDAVRRLAEVESEIHGTSPGDVHLHELGGLDTVVDTVGVAAAVALLGIETVVSAPPALGTGTVRTAHGLLPAPAPATLALLRGVPVVGSHDRAETVTPTGAALLRALDASFGPLPPLVIRSTGYGAGHRQLPGHPNVLPALLGEATGAPTTQILLETNVDDVTGEELAHVIAASLEAGAVDAWVTPIVMKKGRPAHTVHALVDAARAAAVEMVILAETRSLGLRRLPVEKVEQDRDATTVHIEGIPIRVKRGPWGAKPEHDDVARAAHQLDRPLRETAERALDGFWERFCS